MNNVNLWTLVLKKAQICLSCLSSVKAWEEGNNSWPNCLISVFDEFQSNVAYVEDMIRIVNRKFPHLHGPLLEKFLTELALNCSYVLKPQLAKFHVNTSALSKEVERGWFMQGSSLCYIQ